MKWIGSQIFRPFVVFPLFILILSFNVHAQNILDGKVIDSFTGDPLIGANVIIQGSSDGVQTDWDGSFILKTDQELPLVLEISYLGYSTIEREVTTTENSLKFELEEETVKISVVEVR